MNHFLSMCPKLQLQDFLVKERFCCNSVSSINSMTQVVKMRGHYKKNKKLQKLLKVLNRFHSYHGFTILDTTKKSKLRRFYETFILIVTVVNLSLVVLASTEKYGTKEKMERNMFKMFGCGALYLVLCEVIYWGRKNEICELVDWCHGVENYKPRRVTGLKKPKNWFDKHRERTQFFIKLENRGMFYQSVAIYI